MFNRKELSKLYKQLVLEKDTGCWVWTGATHYRSGHGLITARGKTYYVSRMMMELARGEGLRKFEYACHSCNNPACANPDHLYIGTPTDNAVDRYTNHIYSDKTSGTKVSGFRLDSDLLDYITTIQNEFGYITKTEALKHIINYHRNNTMISV